MNIKDCVDVLNYWISKERGSFVTIQEAIDTIHSGQLAYYNDIKPYYATSQRIKEILSPFKKKYDFTPSDTVSGYVVIPSNSNYSDLLDLQVQYAISNRTIYVGVEMVNEDERSNRLNSQLDPVTITSPIGEMGIPRYIRIYPAAGYTGTATYLSTPIKPVYAYTVISGRVIVYDPANSVQLEWREVDIERVLIKALKSIGINLTDADVQNFAQISSQNNAQNFNNT